MRVKLAYPGGVTGHCTWDMDAAERTMTWTVTGTEGTATSPASAVPDTNSRLVVTRHGRSPHHWRNRGVRLGRPTSASSKQR
jgi:hypothetical protein